MLRRHSCHSKAASQTTGIQGYMADNVPQLKYIKINELIKLKDVRLLGEKQVANGVLSERQPYVA